MMTLDTIRQQIDQIDTELVNLLEKRMQLVEEVICFKKENHLPILDSSREQAIQDSLKQTIQHPQYQSAILSIFSCITKESRSYQASVLDRKSDL